MKSQPFLMSGILFYIHYALSSVWMPALLFGSIPFSSWKSHVSVLPACCKYHCPASNCSSCILLFLHMTFRSLLSVLDFSTTLYHFLPEYLFSRTNKKTSCTLEYLTIKKLIMSSYSSLSDIKIFLLLYTHSSIILINWNLTFIALRDFFIIFNDTANSP